MRAGIFLGSALAALLSMVAAQAADKRPSPPPQVCIGANCATAPGPSGPIKWNPGHYAAGNGSMYGGTKASAWYPAMDAALANYPFMKGFRMWITWGAIETAKGTYDFSQVDLILNRLKTQYGTPRHLVLNLYPSGPASSMTPGDTGVVPGYIQQDPAYGPSPVSGSYGWWGINSGGKSTGGFEPALWRPAVMQRYIALVQAIGAHYDNDPNFEGMMFQEDVYNAAAGGSDYSDSAMTTQIKALLTAAVAAFPHTNVIFENTWGPGGVGGAQNLEQWMVDNRVAPGTSDTIGLSAFKQPWTRGRPDALNWGMAAYMGLKDTNSNYTGGDLRPRARAMIDVEADDIAGPYYTQYGGPFTPADVCAAMNSQYQASHAFWVSFTGTEKIRGVAVNTASKWPNLAAALQQCPLTTTSYPPSYP